MKSGRRLITNVDGKLPQPGQIGDVMHSGELGSPSAYAIKDGKIVTSFGNLAYEVTVYKMGDKYFGARSNEFGYANYEIVPTPVNLENLGDPNGRHFDRTELNRVWECREGPVASPADRANKRLLPRGPLLADCCASRCCISSWSPSCFSSAIGYCILHARRSAANRIELTVDDFVQMSVAWLAQGRPPPTSEQMQNLIELKVREEVLYREALALGLDKDDTIVKRRLAQKMEFLADDIASMRSYRGRAEIVVCEQPAALRAAARITFHHLYFSPDQRGESARDAADQDRQCCCREAEAIGRKAQRSPTHLCFRIVTAIGPSTKWPSCSDWSSPARCSALQPGSWQGPIESGYGWHLVLVEDTPTRVPAFEEIEPDVKSAWLAEQRAEARRKSYEAMRARYRSSCPSRPKRTIQMLPWGQETDSARKKGSVRRGRYCSASCWPRAPHRRPRPRNQSGLHGDQRSRAGPLRGGLAHTAVVRDAASGRA